MRRRGTRISLRLKAIVGIGSLYLVLLVAFAYFAVHAGTSIDIKRQEETYKASVRVFAGEVAFDVGAGDIDSIKEKLQEYVRDPNIRYVVVQDVKGIVYDFAPDRLAALPNMTDEAFAERVVAIDPAVDADSVRHFSSPIMRHDKDVGRLRMGVVLMGLRRDIQQHQRLAIQIVIAAVFVGVVMALFVDRQINSALSRLTEVATKMAGGDLSQRVDIHTGDALESLGKSFNQMADSIKAREDELHEVHEQLRRYTENLEEIVEERTKDLRESQRQVIQQEKMAAIGQMAAGIAHEIGNPLTSISSLVQILQRKTESEELKKRLELMRTHIQRISKIVRQAVDFARPGDADWRSCQINDIINEALDITRYDKRSRKLTIETDLDPLLPQATVMNEQLVQVFINLIINAIDAMEKNGGTLTITSRQENSSIVVSVMDTGEGMADDQIGKIFNPFFTTKEVGKGTGLGLSVSYGIIQKHNGTITVKSELGKGSTFNVFLPIA